MRRDHHLLTSRAAEKIASWAMPPKIRELIADLEAAGFTNRGGKGSHRNYRHPRSKLRVTLSGKLGDDAKPYQVMNAKRVIEEIDK